MVKKRFRRVLLISTVTLLLGFLYGIFVNSTGVAVPCVFYKVTGLKCPGCGVTHMCVALLQLNFKEAFQSHPMLFVQLPVLGLIFVKSVVGYIKDGAYRLKRLENTVIYICIALLIGFTVVRNIQMNM